MACIIHVMYCELSAHMHSEGYGSCFVCVSVSYHSSGGIVHFYALTKVPIASIRNSLGF